MLIKQEITQCSSIRAGHHTNVMASAEIVSRETDDPAQEVNQYSQISTTPQSQSTLNFQINFLLGKSKRGEAPCFEVTGLSIVI